MSADEDFAYYDELAMAWRCDKCDAVLLGDGDCPRCDVVAEPAIQTVAAELLGDTE